MYLVGKGRMAKMDIRVRRIGNSLLLSLDSTMGG